MDDETEEEGLSVEDVIVEELAEMGLTIHKSAPKGLTLRFGHEVASKGATLEDAVLRLLVSSASKPQDDRLPDETRAKLYLIAGLSVDPDPLIDIVLDRWGDEDEELEDGDEDSEDPLNVETED